MNQLKFNVGDWCFAEFELSQITRMEDGRVTSYTDGFFVVSGADLSDRCLPLTIDNKIASGQVARWHQKFHALGSNALNFPDLKRELVRRWIEICEASNDKGRAKELYQELEKFGSSVLEKVKSLNQEVVDGVRIFR